MKSFERRTLAQIVTDKPATAPVFEKYELDYCCHGRQSLLEACEFDERKYGQVTHELEKVILENTPMNISGHTDKMMIPMVHYKGRTICFVADLIPSASHIPIPYVMGYDTRPLITMEEKDRFLKEAAEKKYVLFFEHDPSLECCTVVSVDGRVRLENRFKLSEL